MIQSARKAKAGMQGILRRKFPLKDKCYSIMPMACLIPNGKVYLLRLIARLAPAPEVNSSGFRCRIASLFRHFTLNRLYLQDLHWKCDHKMRLLMVAHPQGFAVFLNPVYPGYKTLTGSHCNITKPNCLEILLCLFAFFEHLQATPTTFIAEL